MRMNHLNKIIQTLIEARRVLLISHVMPDGDTIGSTLGLAWALRCRGAGVRVACADSIPDELRFLPGSEEYQAKTRTDEDVIVLLDCSDLGRAGSIYSADAFSSVPVINIDHHITNNQFGDINWTEQRSSTAEIVYSLVSALHIPLDAAIATCLLTGVITDTRGFRTGNTNAETLRTALSLVEAGASLAQVSDAAFNHRSVHVLRLWGAAFVEAELSDGILWAEIPQELLTRTGAPLSASTGLVNFLSTVDQAYVAAVFRELETGATDVSLRSVPRIDVSQVASEFGGGGHPQASGCQVKGGLTQVRERVLGALRESVSDQLGHLTSS